MQTDELWLSSLAARVASLRDAGSAAEILDRLLEASAVAAPRSALFLVRRERLRGFRTCGENPEATRRIAAVDLPIHEGWAARLPKGAGPVAPAGDDSDGPDYGQSAAADTRVVWLNLEGKPMALLRITRREGETPWSPQGLAILAAYAQSRLDLELLRRRREVSASPEPPIATAAWSAPPSADTFRVAVSVPRPSVPSDETGLAPIGRVEVRHEAQSPRIEEARRFARLVATDIRLYNEEAVLVGRRQRDLAQRLGDQMERGRESFQKRFAELGSAGAQLIDDAYVEVLAAGDPSLLGIERPGKTAVTGTG